MRIPLVGKLSPLQRGILLAGAIVSTIWAGVIGRHSAEAPPVMLNHSAPTALQASRQTPSPQGASKTSGVGHPVQMRKEYPAGNSTKDRQTMILQAGGKDAAEIRDRFRVRLFFRRAYHQLNLTLDQIERFESRAASEWPAINFLGTRDGQHPPDEFDRVLQIKRERIERIVKETIGPESIPAFGRLLKESALSQVADEIYFGNLSSGIDMSAAQVELIISLASQYSPSNSSIERIDPSNVDWNAVFNAAGGNLAPAQIASAKAALSALEFDWKVRKLTGLPTRTPTRGL